MIKHLYIIINTRYHITGQSKDLVHKTDLQTQKQTTQEERLNVFIRFYIKILHFCTYRVIANEYFNMYDNLMTIICFDYK